MISSEESLEIFRHQLVADIKEKFPEMTVDLYPTLAAKVNGWTMYARSISFSKYEPHRIRHREELSCDLLNFVVMQREIFSVSDRLTVKCELGSEYSSPFLKTTFYY